MTFKECLDKFHESFPFAEVDDYRPVCYEMFQADKEDGMTIWLKNGDMIVYYPKRRKTMNDDLIDQVWEWIESSDKYGHSSYFCSRCGTQEGKAKNICPNCGVKMKKEVTND